jgi:hypothetical protein
MIATYAGCVYVGSAVNLRARWNVHRRLLIMKQHHNPHRSRRSTCQDHNLSAFCRARGLSVVHMHQLKNGERPSHKGWTWKHDADQAFE